jgi:uncharacterized protein YkwD
MFIPLISSLVLAADREFVIFDNHNSVVQPMLLKNNRLRNNRDLPSHTISLVLTKAAQDQAEYMSKTHDFEHQAKNNGSPGSRAARYGYSGTVRENIGRGHTTVDEVFQQWKDSPSHWASIISDFKEVGFGHASSEDGVQYWVAVYGTSKNKGCLQKSKEFLLISSSRK